MWLQITKIKKTKIKVSLFQVAKLSLQMERHKCPRNISHNLLDVGGNGSLPQRELYFGRTWSYHWHTAMGLCYPQQSWGRKHPRLVWASGNSWELLVNRFPTHWSHSRGFLTFKGKIELKKENIKRKQPMAMPWHSIPDSMVLPASPAPSKPTAPKCYPNPLPSPVASPLPPSTPGRLLFCLFFCFHYLFNLIS